MRTYARMTIYQLKDQNPKSWNLHDTYIDSGENSGKTQIESILEYGVEVADNSQSRIEFEYKVNAEKGYDYLGFQVDGRVIFRKSQTNWTVYSHPLTPGFHTLSWVYFKDITIDFGEDKAKIRVWVVIFYCFDCINFI